VFSQSFPFLTDPGSLGGSTAAIAAYSLIEKSEMDLTIQINGFNTDYSKRLIYLNSLAYVLTQKINNEINAATNRYNTLVSQNNSMSILNYSRKKKNTKVLNIIKQMLTNIDRELSKQQIANVQNGEKLNLYQNTMASLFEIHELMDTVEDQVSQSLLLDTITNRK
tara:strand:- start:10 stop:507 length:498 start_codon:yes stop_codon:yes gene_type:complete